MAKPRRKPIRSLEKTWTLSRTATGNVLLELNTLVYYGRKDDDGRYCTTTVEFDGNTGPMGESIWDDVRQSQEHCIERCLEEGARVRGLRLQVRPKERG